MDEKLYYTLRDGFDELYTKHGNLRTENGRLMFRQEWDELLASLNVKESEFEAELDRRMSIWDTMPKKWS